LREGKGFAGRFHSRWGRLQKLDGEDSMNERRMDAGEAYLLFAMPAESSLAIFECPEALAF
jgi:hypothetical protein